MSDSIVGKWKYFRYASCFHYFPYGSPLSICGFRSSIFFGGSVPSTGFVPQCKKCLRILEKESKNAKKN